MHLSTLFALFALFALVSSQQIDWATLTDTELDALEPDVFLNITASQLGSIPVAAIPGFSSSQVGNIPPESMVGWTPAQLISMNGMMCYGFAPEDIPYMNATLIAAFRGVCSYYFPINILKYINATQLAAFSPDAISRFYSFHFANAPGYAFARWTAQQFAAVDPWECSGFRREQVPFMPPDSLTGISFSCWVELDYDFFWGLTPEQVPLLNATWFNTLTALSMSQIDALTIASFSFDQLRALTPTAIGGLPATGIELLVAQYNLQFIDLFTTYDWQAYPASSMQYFKNFVDGNTIPNTYPVPGSWRDLTWLQLALMTSDPQPTFTALFLETIQGTTFGGLRPDQLQLIPGNLFHYLTAPQIAYFTNDTVDALTEDQLTNIPNSVFGAMPLEIMEILPLDLWSSVLPQQIAHIPPDYFNDFNCSILFAFTALQVSGITRAQDRIFSERIMECGWTTSTSGTTQVSTTGGLPPTSPPPSPTTSTTTSTSSYVKHEGPSGGEIFGILVGGFAMGAITVGIVGYIIVRRRGQYQNIQ